jgi:hypothetical protein
VRQSDAIVGLTHASSVIALVRFSDELSGTVTELLVPLNVSADPLWPVVRVAPVIVPVFARPETSVTVVPDASSNAYAATSAGSPAGPASL